MIVIIPSCVFPHRLWATDLHLGGPAHASVVQRSAQADAPASVVWGGARGPTHQRIPTCPVPSRALHSPIRKPTSASDSESDPSWYLLAWHFSPGASSCSLSMHLPASSFVLGPRTLGLGCPLLVNRRVHTTATTTLKPFRHRQAAPLARGGICWRSIHQIRAGGCLSAGMLAPGDTVTDACPQIGTSAHVKGREAREGECQGAQGQERARAHPQPPLSLAQPRQASSASAATQGPMAVEGHMT